MASQPIDPRNMYESPQEGSNLKDQVMEQADRAKSKLQEVERRAGEQMDQQRGRAASALEGGAAALHQNVDKVTNIAHKAADQLQGTAEYLRQHDARAMMSDVENLVRKYPGQFLAGGVLLGFLLGRTFTSSD
jgi:ElaB/YqjD/DUF883 family membrane-anchored ribosome-binding protein